jgi:methylmalonyl-CoA/ethylmalonyl-CoA epimerase
VQATPGPMFSRVNHLGVIVANLAEARRWLTEVFGLTLSRSVDLPDSRIHAEFYACGGIDIELIEVGDPEQRRRRLGGARQARLEHIAVEVDNLRAALARLAALGVETTGPEPRRVGNTLNAWTVEETTGGISYQLIERIAPSAP